MVKVMAFDGGHEIEKWKTQSSEGAFRHALREISLTDYEQAKIRSNGIAPVEFIKIDNRAFVIGDAAERFGVITKKSGAARYTRDYLGYLFVAALARAYQNGGEVEVVTSHPPRDIIYRDKIMETLVGTWEFECQGQSRTCEVIEVHVFDEPQGGLMNVILTESGTEYENSDLANARTLILDVGGGTCSMIAAEPGGWVDQSFQPDTIQIGISNALSDFENALRERYADEFQSTPTIPTTRLREALTTGVLRGGGEAFPCDDEARHAKSRLLNQIAQRYQYRAGGPKNWDAIVLTGGGSGLILPDLYQILNHKQILTAAPERDIHMANVRGLRKLRNFYKALER